MIAVWGLTWKELIRKRVTLMTAIITILFWITLWLVANAVASDTNPLLYIGTVIPLLESYAQAGIIMMIGFFFGAFALAFLSIFSAVSAITGEAEHGVLQSVLARPIPRWQWFLGRWLGFVSYGAIYAFLLFASIITISWIETGLLFEGLVLLKSLLLFASVVPLLVSMTMLGSCWLGPLGNGISMTMLFGMGWLGSTIGRLTSAGMGSSVNMDNSTVIDTITGLIRLVMPADALQQRMLHELFAASETYSLASMSRLQTMFAIGEVPSNLFLMYCAVYTVILFLTGMLVLRNKDF